LIYRFK